MSSEPRQATFSRHRSSFFLLNVIQKSRQFYDIRVHQEDLIKVKIINQEFLEIELFRTRYETISYPRNHDVTYVSLLQNEHRAIEKLYVV